MPKVHRFSLAGDERFAMFLNVFFIFRVFNVLNFLKFIFVSNVSASMVLSQPGGLTLGFAPHLVGKVAIGHFVLTDQIIRF